MAHFKRCSELEGYFFERGSSVSPLFHFEIKEKKKTFSPKFDLGCSPYC